MDIQQGRVADASGASYNPQAEKYWAKFFTRAEKQNFESERQGKPVYKTETFVTITKNKYFTQTFKLEWKPNHFGNMAPSPKTAEILDTYADEWEIFQEALASAKSGGTALRVISDDKALLAALEELGITTVEQVVEAGDKHEVLLDMPKYDLLLLHSKEYLDRANEIARKDETIAQLKAQLAAMAQPAAKAKPKKQADNGSNDSTDMPRRSGSDKSATA